MGGVDWALCKARCAFSTLCLSRSLLSLSLACFEAFLRASILAWSGVRGFLVASSLINMPLFTESAAAAL